MFLEEGDHFDFGSHRVRKQINEAEVRMLTYNRSIPDPPLQVKLVSKVNVTTSNYL